MFCACICVVSFYDRRHSHWQSALISSRVVRTKSCVHGMIHRKYTHKTCTKHAKYRDKTHNSTPGGEINTILTWQKILDRVIRLGPSFARRPSRGTGGAPRRPSGKRWPETDNPARIPCHVSIVYISQWTQITLKTHVTLV